MSLDQSPAGRLKSKDTTEPILFIARHGAQRITPRLIHAVTARIMPSGIGSASCAGFPHAAMAPACPRVPLSSIIKGIGV
ncbi:unnamed protein product [Gadus morhua 'NCC']